MASQAHRRGRDRLPERGPRGGAHRARCRDADAPAPVAGGPGVAGSRLRVERRSRRDCGGAGVRERRGGRTRRGVRQCVGCACGLVLTAVVARRRGLPRSPPDSVERTGDCGRRFPAIGAARHHCRVRCHDRRPRSVDASGGTADADDERRTAVLSEHRRARPCRSRVDRRGRRRNGRGPAVHRRRGADPLVVRRLCARGRRGRRAPLRRLARRRPQVRPVDRAARHDLDARHGKSHRWLQRGVGPGIARRHGVRVRLVLAGARHPRWRLADARGRRRDHHHGQPHRVAAAGARQLLHQRPARRRQLPLCITARRADEPRRDAGHRAAAAAVR